MTATISTVAITCKGCGTGKQVRPTRKELARLPRGWHRHEGTWCAECWAKRYRLRAVILPVLRPLGADWQTFRTVLASCWHQSTALANWAVTELAKADVVRMPGDDKMPAMPRVYLYPDARKQIPSMTPTALNAVLHAVEGKYRKARLETIWRSAASLPRQRYPVPYPLHNQSWAAAWQEYEGEDGQTSRVPTVTVTLSGQRFTLQLRSARRRRQLAAFGQIASGAAIQGELAFYRVRATEGDHRNGTNGKRAGGGNMVRYDVMCKMVAWLPVPQSERQRAGTLDVRTGTHAFLVAVAPERERPWVLRSHQVRRQIAGYRKKLLAFSEDLKAERRPASPSEQDYLNRLSLRHRNRMRTYCQQAANWLCNFAARQNLAAIRYDDSERRYCPEFPWAALAGAVAQKCSELGMQFTKSSGEVVETEVAAE